MGSAVRLAPWLLLIPAVTYAAPGWLDWVEPIISPAEKHAYMALTAAERQKFEEDFWANKPITAEEYYRRIETIDANFGSSNVDLA